ncbi:MAG: 16S rRNA (cytosine(1402)-N(4))-methyltransferase RsmH [Fimbriimonadales bacterium]|nr:16S rRNA (cytosine(1402)-N(4))-methyltransferase RsmH [Fimbriimonadales bacterium]MDW8052378.1 16S rRNA (cytosine(1402)-N(4))-methyltransferase RsmH [Armatimonadota bacterium]
MHKPVMVREVLELLNPPVGGTVVDATVGTGGHARALAERIGATGTLVAIDRDASMLELARQNLADVRCTVYYVHADYRNLPEVLRELNIEAVDAILVDMGVCSAQLDDPERGMAFRYDAPLDMRLDRDQPTTAYHLLQRITFSELVRILREYGNERWAKPIARAIIHRRNQGRMNTTGDLAAAVLEAIPKKFQEKRIHPATRTFQAIRIAVNRELEGLQPALEAMAGCLKIGGVMCVLAYHSLEDRAVKLAFRNLSQRTRVLATVGGAEQRGGSQPVLEILTPKPLEPSEAEVQENPRARSAKLRAARRVA